MSTRVFATTMLNAISRHELREQLVLNVDPASELRRLNSMIAYRQLTVTELQQLISTPRARSVLTALAPTEFGGVRAHMENGSRSALETTAADLQAELAETVTVAISVVTAATRDITANIFATSGYDLGYTCKIQHAETATAVELHRGDEVLLVTVQDGGYVKFAHGGLGDETCAEHQRELERAAERHGVVVTQCP